MSVSNCQTYNIACPKCGRAQDVSLYETVDVGLSPQLREQIIRNELNKVDCPSCSHSFRIDKVLLYKDLGRKALILLVPGDPAAGSMNDDELYDRLHVLCGMLPEGVDAPAFHLVHSRVELVERIFLLESHLDERIIEYIKYIIYSKNIERINPREKTLLLNAVDSDEENLCFIVQDVNTMMLESVLKYERRAYDALYEMFDCDDHTPDLLEIFPGPYINARLLLLQEDGEV